MMPPIRIPPAHDIPKIVSFSLDETVRRYRHWLLKGANLWGYEPARSMLAPSLQHSAPLDWLLKQCDMTRPTQGREPNKQIIRALWDLGASKAWKVYDAPTWRLPFRAHLSTRIPADCLIVEADRPFLFWMQMRQGSTAPTIQQMALLMRFALYQAEKAGYAEVGIMIADMRRTGGDRREVSLLTAEDLRPPSVAEAEAVLQRFADAHDTLVREGFDPKQERASRRAARGSDSAQPSLF